MTQPHNPHCGHTGRTSKNVLWPFHLDPAPPWVPSAEALGTGASANVSCTTITFYTAAANANPTLAMLGSRQQVRDVFNLLFEKKKSIKTFLGVFYMDRIIPIPLSPQELWSTQTVPSYMLQGHLLATQLKLAAGGC